MSTYVFLASPLGSGVHHSGMRALLVILGTAVLVWTLHFTNTSHGYKSIPLTGMNIDCVRIIYTPRKKTNSSTKMALVF